MFIEKVQNFTGVRNIPIEKLYRDGEPIIDRMIAGFESECVRLTDSFKQFQFDENNPKEIPFIKEIMVLDCYHEDILKQILDTGILIAGEKFIMYSSSTNQQKNKQVCLLQEKFYKKNISKLMCGLTLDIINRNGGINIGKYLAYDSLVFSKSVELDEEIDIDSVIVLPEFETKIFDKVNYIDMENHTIEQREMDVPVNHMDGAGMLLPGVLPCSAQIRGGYIKGCVFPFDFRQFIIEKQKDGSIKSGTVIKDAWGNDVEIDYIRDNVKLILNTSQLKMWKYYASWDEYKKAFKENEVKICINNMMHYPEADDPIVPAAYQFFQTIPRENMTDEKIENLSALTIQLIKDAKTKPETALKIMGVEIEDRNTPVPPFYAAIKAYPEMLQDSYVKKKIGNYIESQRKKAMSGKVYIKGFYNYICPDLYAACEHWLCGVEIPEGLIPRNHVYNQVYNDKVDITEVCCLRSPHLSDCEHGIRNLVKTEECKKWFFGCDTVISTHDLLTYTLVCDVDGDEMLLAHDKAFIDLLDREKVPLYYEMRKGEACQVDNENLLHTLHNSFANSVIGYISNALTKHLNDESEPDLRFVRFMTAYNNFCIDFPKSQYMPELEAEYKEKFEELCAQDCQYPHFFKYAKDKKADRCNSYDSKNEQSNVNRISKHIQEQTASNKENIWLHEDGQKMFNPQYFQFPETEIKVDRKSETYRLLLNRSRELKLKNTRKHVEKLKDMMMDKHGIKLSYDLFYYYCNREILDTIRDDYNVLERIGIRKKAAAYLLDIEYYQPEYRDTSKEILWNCFGDLLYDNLLHNLKIDGRSVLNIKKMAYQTKQERAKKIANLVAEAEQELKENGSVSIHEQEYKWISNLKCRKGCEKDKYLLYALLVLFKRKLQWLDAIDDKSGITEDNMKCFRIYKNTKGSVTRGVIDNWIGHDIAQKGLKRLEKKGVIKVVECNEYYKVYLQIQTNIMNCGEVLFSVEEWNPMINYYEYTGEKPVKNCVVCTRKFIAEGNTKTCGTKCSRLLVLQNKNIYNTKNKDV